MGNHSTLADIDRANRLGGLRRFATGLTLLNILGHTVLGFELPWAQPLVGLATAYSLELLLELVESKAQQRPPLFSGGIQQFIDFLLPAHISGLAVAMLLYANEQLLPIAFATALAIGSKALFRVQVNNRSRHFFNPSNLGISVTLLLFPWVGVAQPYQFTENLSGAADWLLPIALICIGTFLNSRYTHRILLILSWVGGFILQAILRSWLCDTPLIAALMPLTGVTFIVFTFYMISDPGTTPIKPLGQIAFGLGMAITYGLLMTWHIVFGLFWGLTIVCIVRGLSLVVIDLLNSDQQLTMTTTTSITAGGEV